MRFDIILNSGLKFPWTDHINYKNVLLLFQKKKKYRL